MYALVPLLVVVLLTPVIPNGAAKDAHRRLLALEERLDPEQSVEAD